MGRDERKGFWLLRSWMNSVLAHILLLVVGMMMLFFSTTLTVLLTRPPPSAQTVTLYEVARLLRHLPIGKDERTAEVEVAPDAAPPAPGRDRTAHVLTQGLATYLGVPLSSVRLSLAEGPQVPITTLEREQRFFSADHAFNPVIYGQFHAALRGADGRWTVLVRKTRNPYSLWRKTDFMWIAWSFFGGIALALWCSSRIVMPLRRFSTAVAGVGPGEPPTPLEIDGPAELRLTALRLNDMQARIERYIAERNSVTGAIAHDLRGPLSRLAFHLADAPDAVRINAQQEIEEMEQMIAVTLDFVSHDTRVQHKEPLDLAMLVEGVVDDLADMGRDVAMTGTGTGATSDGTIMQGDALLLRRLFANLIDNALKYGGSARVRVDVRDGMAIVDVDDGGAGMTPHDIDRAFEPFYRGEPSRNRRTGGVGLGLSIVKHAAEAHGGDIHLSNLRGAGLRARVTLPLTVRATNVAAADRRP